MSHLRLKMTPLKITKMRWAILHVLLLSRLCLSPALPTTKPLHLEAVIILADVEEPNREAGPFIKKDRGT